MEISKEKYLVDIEFRYSGEPLYHNGSVLRNKTLAIGVYDNFEGACVAGNNLLEQLESRFPLHVFPSGKVAPKERFSKNGGCFGSKNTLVTNLAYLKTPFEFYAKITTLKFRDIDAEVDDVINSIKEYREYRSKEDQE
jgi:hypothetical protein